MKNLIEKSPSVKKDIIVAARRERTWLQMDWLQVGRRLRFTGFFLLLRGTGELSYCITFGWTFLQYSVFLGFVQLGNLAMLKFLTFLFSRHLVFLLQN